MKIVATPLLRTFVEDHLLDGQSPENIAGRLKRHKQSFVSKDSIYRFIKSPYGRNIEVARLRLKSKGRRKKHPQLTDRTFIEERPLRAEQRTRIGDAEADFIVSGKSGRGILLVMTDRKIRVSFLEKISRVSIENVHRTFERIQDRFPEMKTLTTDNDILFRKHRELAKRLHVKIFFCHPYHSWEKGSVENTNKHIRKEIPKGSDLSRYSKEFIHSMERKLNRRFMKCLNHATPQELPDKARKQKNTKRGVRIEPVG